MLAAFGLCKVACEATACGAIKKCKGLAERLTFLKIFGPEGADNS